MALQDLSLAGSLYCQVPARVRAATDQQRRLRDERSDAERARYASHMLAEARAIVAGTSNVRPHPEHLRLLLQELDRAAGSSALSTRGC
jgi:hypothetical protein